jgi:hypothetical protein
VLAAPTPPFAREAQQNQEFRDRLRAAEIQAQLHPLRAIRQAAATRWRAAAWWLERTQSDFARRDPDSISTKRVRTLFQNLLDVVDKERLAPSTCERLRWHILAAMNGTAHKTQTARQTRRQLSEAIEYFANKDRCQDPAQELLDVNTEILLELGHDAPEASKPATPFPKKTNAVPRDLHQPTSNNHQPAA